MGQAAVEILVASGLYPSAESEKKISGDHNTQHNNRLLVVDFEEAAFTTPFF